MTGFACIKTLLSLGAAEGDTSGRVGTFSSDADGSEYKKTAVGADSNRANKSVPDMLNESCTTPDFGCDLEKSGRLIPILCGGRNLSSKDYYLNLLWGVNRAPCDTYMTRNPSPASFPSIRVALARLSMSR